MLINLKDILGIALIYTGILDGYKYWIQAKRVNQIHSAKAISRKFINYAILSDIVKMIYAITIHDIYIFGIAVLALICMLRLFWVTYLWYPYRMRGCNSFKRPNILKYTWNSILSNSIRKKL